MTTHEDALFTALGMDRSEAEDYEYWYDHWRDAYVVKALLHDGTYRVALITPVHWRHIQEACK